VPKNTVNACAIFNEKYLWYKFAKATERKWGAPIELQMAIIRKESGYDWLARPERTKLFKVIPWKRKSSSLGYSQAIEDTWETYKKSTGKKYVTRVLFKDASDFVGWYVDQTYRKMKISKTNYFKQYIYYYNGWTKQLRPESISYAKTVDKTARKYKKQITRCQSKLNQKKYIIF
tara:strand:- start:429 stop:953 length:525 start_codon:yes stop_codon:yes gene_type:complete